MIIDSNSIPDEWTHYIYKATCLVNGKHYIGLSGQRIGYRITQHRHQAIEGNCQVHFHRAIRKYGWENFNFEIVAFAISSEAAKLIEADLIQDYDSFNEGYNSTLGGEGCNGFKMPREHVEKVRAYWTGRKKSPEQIECMRQVALGRKHTDSAKEKCRIAALKKVITDEVRENISLGALKRSDKLHFYNPNIGYFYGHIKELCNEFPHLNNSQLTSVKKGKRNHHHKWVVLSDEFNDMSLSERVEHINNKQVLGSKVYGRIAA